MIDIRCGCAAPRQLPESAVGRRFRCPACAIVMQVACAEPLADGGGAGDFDAGFTVTAGPQIADARILVGGVADLAIGKQPGCHVLLPGGMVSRVHAKLRRVDFGPSRWKVVDNHSTNGLFVNGERVAEHDLSDGDVVAIGEFQLRYARFAPEEELTLAPVDEPASAYASGTTLSPTARYGPAVVAPAPARVPAGAPSSAVAAALRGPVCPSCEKTLPGGAKICVGCGINVATGRPVLTSQGVDENMLYESAQRWIWWVSWLVWVTPMPIPIRSEAFGTRKPYAIWTIAAATVLASITFFFAQNVGGANENDRPGRELMLWAPRATGAAVGAVPGASAVDSHKAREIARRLSEEQREAVRELADDPTGRLSEDERFERGLAIALAMEAVASRGEFHWYQLLTHAFLHDTSSVYNFAMHLAGNMMFLLVFGTRVNALIGNVATAILYPVLAVGAALVHLASLGDGPSGPMLGASGAIMGLAGTYLILFPAHQVFCAMWISLWLRFRRVYGCKIFPLRGFWVLLIYFGYDVLMNYVSSHFGFGEGVAHWAHIGGFLTGMTLALGVLFSRQFNTHGGDVLSVTLGKHAWPLIGKPSRWNGAAPALPPGIAATPA